MANKTASALAYGSYDFSNSGYALAFQSFLFPLLLSAAGGGQGSSGALWGTIVALSSLLAVVAGPFIGRFADKIGKGGVFAALVLLAGGMAAVAPTAFEGRVWALAVAFVLFNTIFELSQSLYDSFLVDFRAGTAELTRLSTFAWGFGYLGGAVAAVVYLLLDKAGRRISTTLTVLAVMFVLLSVPAIVAFWQRKPARVPERFSWREIRQVSNPVPWRDIVVYWLIADSVGAVMYFTPLYMREELQIDTKQLGMLVLGMQLVAFPLTVMMGRVASRLGVTRTIRASLLVWLVGLTGLYFARTVLQLLPALALLALVVGSTQALLRVHFALRLSNDRSGEGFGFFAIAQKSASIAAPALVAVLSWATGSLRPTYIGVAILVAVAYGLSRRMSDARRTEA